jgi:hypothetical protein
VAFGRRRHASSGAGDMASLGGVVVDDVAVSLSVVVSTSPPRVGPNAGSHRGARWRRWQPRTMVVGGGGGGSGKRWGTSQCVTSVTFQPRLLDLATRGRLLIINSNYS